MVVTPAKNGFAIEYSFRENGRGPTSKEVVTLDREGIPTKWSIDMTTHFGGKLGEEFAIEGGRARWSIAGKADSEQLRPPNLYAATFASPWSTGQYVRVLLKMPDHRTQTLPAGSLRVQKLRETTLDGVAVTAYALINADDRRQLVILDRDDKLFAALEEHVVVREGNEGAAPAIEQLGQEVERQRHLELARQLMHRFPEPVRVRNVRLFDPSNGKLVGPVSVVFFRGVITAVNRADEPPIKGERSVDGEGGTLVPGLHDLHSHTSPDTGLMGIAAGVTTVRDMGAEPTKLLDYMASIEKFELIGPRILPSGFIDGPGPDASRSGIVANTQEEALAAIRYYAQRGYVQTKIYNSIPVDWIPAMVGESHRLGMRVAGHLPVSATPKAMIDAGYDEVTHINQLMLGWLLKPGEDPRTAIRLTALKRAATLDVTSSEVTTVIEAMKAKHVPLDTTIAIMERLILSRDGEVQPGDAAFIDHVTGSMRQSRMITLMPMTEPGDDNRYRAAFERMIELLGKMNEAGVMLYPGTDDGNGFTLHRELELYVRAGMTPAQAVSRATLESAQYLGHADQWGSISRGKAADFILISGDPTLDISAIRQIRMTVAGGAVYFPAEIYSRLGIKPFAQPPRIEAPH